MRSLITLIFMCFISCLMAQATLVQSPNELPLDNDRIKVFLGGSIDMGNSENWQARIEEELQSEELIILNPRRDDWNKEWKPVSSDSNFRVQVEWELAALEYADIIIMYFAPQSQSPISLLEYGLYAKSDKLIVFCPKGFWRKGNVDIVAERYDIQMVESFEELIAVLRKRIG